MVSFHGMGIIASTLSSRDRIIEEIKIKSPQKLLKADEIISKASSISITEHNFSGQRKFELIHFKTSNKHWTLTLSSMQHFFFLNQKVHDLTGQVICSEYHMEIIYHLQQLLYNQSSIWNQQITHVHTQLSCLLLKEKSGFEIENFFIIKKNRQFQT